MYFTTVAKIFFLVVSRGCDVRDVAVSIWFAIGRTEADGVHWQETKHERSDGVWQAFYVKTCESSWNMESDGDKTCEKGSLWQAF